MLMEQISSRIGNNVQQLNFSYIDVNVLLHLLDTLLLLDTLISTIITAVLMIKSNSPIRIRNIPNEINRSSINLTLVTISLSH